ncbi:MAG TPA: ABC transporter substrate-binding protein, partial [Burkholderiales bacterium]
AAFRNGTIEAAGVTLDEALQLGSGPDRLRIVLVFDFSAGADVLLARPEITGLRDLRGRRVGVESGAEGDYILFRILEFAGLRAEDIQVVDLPLDRHIDAYRAGEVDAVVTFDPARIELLAAGARELFSSRAIADEVMDVLVVKEQAIESRQRALRRVAEGHFRAADKIRQDPALEAQTVPRRFGPPGEVLEAWRLIEFQGRTGNERLLSDGAIRSVIERVHAVMLRTRLHGRPVDLSALVDDRFVRSAAP